MKRLEIYKSWPDRVITIAVSCRFVLDVWVYDMGRIVMGMIVMRIWGGLCVCVCGKACICIRNNDWG